MRMLDSNLIDKEDNDGRKARDPSSDNTKYSFGYCREF